MAPAETLRAQSDVLRAQARHFEALGSPLYAKLADWLADDPTPASRALEGRHDWYLALRLFSGVHYLVLTGVAPDALSGSTVDFSDALRAHAGELRAWIRERGIQTNEVQRCIGLLPSFLTIAAQMELPLELLELGPAAGLNLQLDRYRYRYAQGAWGPRDSALELVADEEREVPAEVLAGELRLRRCRGIDLAPIDATTGEGLTVLRAYLWPGRQDRAARLDAAVAVLRASSQRPELITGDYVELLPPVLADRPSDAVTVVFQTASTGYLTTEQYAQVRATLDEAGADGRPLAWVSARRRDEREGTRDDRYELELRAWPEPARLVANLDFHGNVIDWVG